MVGGMEGRVVQGAIKEAERKWELCRANNINVEMD